MSHVEKKLAELHITLPQAAAPAANYVSYVVSGKMVTISGQLPVKNGSYAHAVGRLGEHFSVEQGQAFARECAINLLAQVKSAAGSLDTVRCIKLGVFIHATPDFTQHPAVANGASDLIAEALGEKGKHARSAVGVGSLPFGVAVEIDAVFEII